MLLQDVTNFELIELPDGESIVTIGNDKEHTPRKTEKEVFLCLSLVTHTRS